MAFDRDHEPIPDFIARASLSGQNCAVVGGGSGIGRQICHALCQAGGHVICIDLDIESARAVAAETRGNGYRMDATQAGEVEQIFRQIVAEHGPLNVVVDIVGASAGRPLMDVDDTLILQNFSINLFQAMHVTRIASVLMAEGGGGTIVLIGSAAGIVCLPNQAIYGAAKAALHHFVRSAATEVGHLGVRVNAVAPGYVKTERMIARFAPDMWEEIAANTPLQRAGATSDIAAVALFFASELSGFVTGQVLVADGGLLNAPRIMRHSSARQIAGQIPNRSDQ